MTRKDLAAILAERTDSDFVDREILERRPWIFQNDGAFALWRETVAGELHMPRDCIRIVGSAATGFSLSPMKAGRPFRAVGAAPDMASDIDVALVDSGLFTDAWNVIVASDRARGLRVPGDVRDKLRLDLYWGVVGQRTVPLNTSPARQILTAMAVAGRLPPLRGYVVRCRLYRRIEDLRAYHVDSLRHLRTALSGALEAAGGQ